jgi:hypothetical protein
VRDPSGVTVNARHVGSSGAYDTFIGDAIDWEYPAGPAPLIDGRYTATWYTTGHDEPIGSRTFERRDGMFLVGSN